MNSPRIVNPQPTAYTTADLAHWRESILRAAAVAAAFIAEKARSRHEIVWREKSPTDFVTDVDIGAEERIRASLQSSIRELRYVGEELGPTGDTSSGLVAIVDPLDGTSNFLHGYPAYCVSIGIVLDGAPVAAVVHDVARGGVYSATAGGGAYLNDVPIRVSNTTSPTRALIGTGFPFRSDESTAQYTAQLAALIPQVSGMRRAGAAALDLCDLASGRFDAFWELDLAPWDIAAGLLLVREAGGIVTDLDGRHAGIGGGAIVGSNGELHEWFLRTLVGAHASRAHADRTGTGATGTTSTAHVDELRADAARMDAVRADAARADALRANAMPLDAPAPNAIRADTVHSDARRVDSPRADSATDASRIGPPWTDPVRGDTPPSR